MVGVYVIRNRITGKKYVGESLDIKRRWREHKAELAKGKHHSKRLQKDYNRYGKLAFSYKVLERFWFTKGANRDKLKFALLLREGYYMDVLDSDLDYNEEHSIADLKKIADTGRGNPKFAKYKRYRRFIRRNIGYAKHWRPHIMVAGLYNPFVKILVIGVIAWMIYCILSHSSDLSSSASNFIRELTARVSGLM